MNCIEVQSIQASQDFIKLPHRIYAGDPHWVCPLDSQIAGIFDPARNNFFTHGVLSRWLVYSDEGVVVGRIAAFINDEKASQHEIPTGGLGFFECIEDARAAQLLLDSGIRWLRERNMKAAEAPINFGENDSFWGLLVEGFTDPYLGMNYNPPYYQRLLEDYGFVKSYDQISNTLYHKRPFPERFTKIADWVSKKPGYRFEHLRKQDFSKFAADFKEIYNDAWKDFENFVPVHDATLVESFKQLLPIMDEKLIWFAYVHDEPVSFVVIIPDANVWIKPLKGKMSWWGKMHFLWNRYTIKPKRMRAIVMGTKTAYQKHGLESVLFIKLKEYVLPKNQYEELELSWVGDFNEKMMAIHKAMNTDFARRHRTYRYVFPSLSVPAAGPPATTSA